MIEKDEKELTAKDPLAHDEFVAQAPVSTTAEERPQSGHATALNIVVNPLKVSFAKIPSKTELVALHQVGLRYSY